MSFSTLNISALFSLAFIASSTSLILPIHNTSSIPNTLPSNSTTSLSDIAPLLDNVHKPVCSAFYFGGGLQPASCLEAIGKIGTGRGRLSFGPRSLRAFDVQTPRRLSSSDGTCVIEISHKEGTAGDIASKDEIFSAAWDILQSCVRNMNSEGGLVRGLGQFGSLLVGIRRYDPSVTCLGSYSSVRYMSQDLLDKIPITSVPQVFGPGGKPRADVVVPTVITSDSRTPSPYNWQAKIDTLDGKAVVGRWWDLCAGAVAVNAMCVEKYGRTGQALFQGGLRIVLDHEGSGR